jgi:hypothetical protein
MQTRSAASAEYRQRPDAKQKETENKNKKLCVVVVGNM